MIHLQDIQRVLRGRIAINEPMNRYTSIRIGGPADFLLEPADREDAVRLLSHFQENGTPFTMIGKGSNMLISDEGIRGTVVHLEPGLNSVAMDGDLVNAGAGIPMARFVDFCVQQGLSGVECVNAKHGGLSIPAVEAAETLGIACTGGSDTRGSVDRLGLAATLFSRRIVDEQDLVHALRSGHCWPVECGTPPPPDTSRPPQFHSEGIPGHAMRGGESHRRRRR